VAHSSHGLIQGLLTAAHHAHMTISSAHKIAGALQVLSKVAAGLVGPARRLSTYDMQSRLVDAVLLLLLLLLLSSHPPCVWLQA
jgi:hypothetical protein